MDIESFRKLPPLQVTFDELKAIIGPITQGYAWGENTIRDLWLLGAPVPHKSTARIVFPHQLAKWLEDVLNRQGRPLTDAAKTYMELRTKSV